MSSGTGAVHRYRLAAEPQAPSRARRAVGDVLTEHGHGAAIEVAALLVTELVTNAVVHAGTELEIEVSFDPNGVTVAVIDCYPGIMNAPRVAIAQGEIPEGGRGLALVDALAGAWGTAHSAAGKTIWFRIENDPDATPAKPPAPPIPTKDVRRRRPVHLAVAAVVQAQLTTDEYVGELMSRLLDAVGGDGAAVHLADSGDQPRHEIARGVPNGGKQLRVPLLLAGRELGELVIDVAEGEFTNEDQQIAELVAARIAVAIRAQELADVENQRSGWIAFLAEASDLLSGSLDVDRSLILLCQLSVSRLATWAAVYLDDEVGAPRLTAAAHQDEAATDLLRERIAGRPFIDPLASASDDVIRLGDGEETGVAVRLRARGRALGWLCVVRPRAQPFYTEETAGLTDLARRAGLAIDNARLYQEQLQVAHALQQGLLPPELPAPAALDFGACYHAARVGLSVGGDFYDVIQVSESEWVVAIGDVCGKGAEAAAVTGVVRDVLRLLVQQGYALPDALRSLNQTLLQQGQRSRFCTLATARLTSDRPGRWSAFVVQAGHPPAALLRADGNVSFVGRTGTLLGVLNDDELDLEPTTVPLEAGDALVFYTDGVTERRAGNDRLFGDSGLLAVLRGCAGMDAATTAVQIEQATTAFGDDPPHDDMAVLVIRHPVVEATVESSAHLTA